MLKERQRSIVVRRKFSVASIPSAARRVRQVSGDDKKARARPIFFVSANTVQMGAGGGGHHFLKRDAFTGLWMTAAFLAACGVCRQPLADEDAYIYRGEFAFCSDECRELYIKWKRACSRRSRRKAPSNKSSNSRGSCGGPG
ncbi:hypothetical protein CFC21_093575 [Triticum aestivum]|uniref:FLZ-type domain-containing protein n=2 Tax=Triticum aestivum TaxID=4565 RepID=A0A3B6QKR3_WHEAT|nr:uncharacterized protein LOC123141766 [Triticum aestivum]KAF7090896.1 hypothetical protein CFC21_093575 [Triticum aestivum]